MEWLEIYKTHDLIRNRNIFPGHIFLSKNSDENTKNKGNYKIYQLVNTHTYK